MYPGEILNLFPPFPRTNMAFVAMSFDNNFLPRWEEVISPALSKIKVNDEPLKPHRVDLSNKSDSVITEIVKNIAECRVILADISTIGYLPIDSKTNKPIRNANVLYEVGIAHASRLPEEVILIRSDKDQIDFDISGVRVHQYDPENIDDSKKNIQDLVIKALNSINDKKQLAVERAVRSLDLTMYFLLQESLVEIKHPQMRTMGNVVANLERVSAINRMLSSGLFEINFKKLTTESFDEPQLEMVSYVSTPFGREVLAKAREMNDFNKAFSDFIKTEKGKEFIENLKTKSYAKKT